MTRALKIFLGLCVVLGLAAVASPAAAQDSGKFAHPYIFDGKLKESPLKLEFSVTDVRSRYGDYGRRFIDHYLSDKYDGLIDDLKARYKSQKPLCKGYKIIGYIWLTQQEAWSFTLRDTDTRVEYVMVVRKGADNQGAVISLDTQRFGSKSAAFKRTWMGSSPAKGKKNSVSIKAY